MLMDFSLGKYLPKPLGKKALYSMTTLTLVVLMLLVSSTAWSAEIQRGLDFSGIFDPKQDIGVVVDEFVTDGNSVITAKRPKSFEECKTTDTRVDTTGFPIAFKQDVRNHQVQLINSETKVVARIAITYKKTQSTISQTYQRGVLVDPQSSKVFDSWMDLKLRGQDRVLSIKGFAPTIVECKEKFTAQEMAQLRKEKADKDMKLRERRAKEREDALRWEIVFDNCMADKLPLTENRELNASVRKICERIATEPSWWQRFWYAD